MRLCTLEDVSVTGRRILIRSDLNVPIEQGRVTNSERLRASLRTIEYCRQADAGVIIASHLGRPNEGEYSEEWSLRPVAGHLSQLLECEVPVITDWREGVEVSSGQVVMLENTRFEVGETSNDAQLAEAFASICDVFVMDAFGTAHRAHASTLGVAQIADEACAGLLVVDEVKALTRAMDGPVRPLTAVIGGAKVSTKIDVVKHLASMSDTLILGGGMANTMLLASGYDVGRSLSEPDQLDLARHILDAGNVPIPVDVIVASEIGGSEYGRVRDIDDVRSAESIVDIGPETARRYGRTVADSATVIWNGPMGVFEYDQFGEGTRVLGSAIAESSAFTVGGGGDTIAAMDKYGLTGTLDYTSTAGGAFLEFVAGKSLPVLDALRV